EPFRMLLDPGMVGRALDGEIQRDLHAVPLGRGNEAAKILQRSEIRMDGGMTALLGPDRIGTAGVVRTAGKRVVRSLAEGPADGMDRHEVDDVEAHIANLGQPPFAIPEGRRPSGFRSL